MSAFFQIKAHCPFIGISQAAVGQWEQALLPLAGIAFGKRWGKWKAFQTSLLTCGHSKYKINQHFFFMTSLRLKFRPSVSRGREGTVFLQVVRHRVVRSFSTGCHIYPDEWDEASASVRIVGTRERKAQLQKVSCKVRWMLGRIAAVMAEREAAAVEYSADDIVAECHCLPQCHTWFGFIRSLIAEKEGAGRWGTAKTYRDALSSFACFRGGEDIVMDDLDEGHMGRYEEWLKGRGLKRNSSSCYLRTLRTLYRKAVGRGLVANKDIFRGVFTGFAKTSKRAITVESVRAVRSLRLAEGSPLAFARDMFLLSLYLQGISFVDLAYLRKSDIRCGRLLYDRKKTRQSIAVGWEPAMQAIVDRYASLTSGSPYLLPIITRQDGTERRQYERAEHNVNRNLKKVGVMAGIGIPLTTYVARHTWASTMRDMGCDLSVVSAGLGHENLRTTQIYLSTIDTATVEKANRKLLDRILG